MQLSANGHAISADVAVLDGGAVLVGPEVDDLRTSEPARLIPRVLARVGDPITIVSGDEELTGQQLVAQVVVWVAQQVADTEHADAQKIMMTVPASWGAHRRSLLLEALAESGLPDTALVSEPEAAVARYVDRNGWADTAIVAVVGIGASGLRAAVVRGDGHDQQVLGVPDGSDGVGGRAFDDAMTRHVATALGVTLPTLGGTDSDEDGRGLALPISDDAAAQLRALCTEAKELLSIDTHVTIEPTALGTARVRMVRSELESLIRKSVVASVDALRRTVRSAGLSGDDVNAVVLVGGSAQVPLIAEVFSTEFGRPVEVDPDPSFALALGAARLAADAAGPAVDYDDYDEDGEEATPHGFALNWRRPRKPAILVAAACVLALISGAGLVAATATDGPGQSEQRPSRAVNLTTSPAPTPGGEGPTTEPSPSSTSEVGVESAPGDSSSSAEEDLRPDTRTRAADPPEPAVTTPVTTTDTIQPSTLPEPTPTPTPEPTPEPTPTQTDEGV